MTNVNPQPAECVARPTVSILIKALNEAENIERCIHSCLEALEGIDGEIIVADSLSDDATVALASRHPVTVVQLRSPRDRGCGVGAQLAFQHSRGEFLHVIDGDMELPRGFLPQALLAMEREPRVAGVAGQLEEVRPATDLARIRGRRRRPAHAGAGEVETLNGGGLYRREAIEDAGGYLTHPSLHSHEEFELGLRLRSRGWQLIRIAEVSMRHAGHTQAAFGLLGRRWRTRYAFGAGELLRLSCGRPWLGAVLSKLRFHCLAWALWLLAGASLALVVVSPWFAAGAVVAAVLPVLLMMAVKRSVYLGLYAVAAWHVFAAGAVAGAWTLRRGGPARRIDCVVVHAPGPGATTGGDDLTAAGLAGNLDAGPPAPATEPVPAKASPDPVAPANPYSARNVRTGLLQFMSGRLYTGVVQLLVIALYVRYMVVEDYAAYATYSGLGAVASSLTLLGLERAAMRYYPEARLSGSVAGFKRLVRALTLARLALLLFVVAIVIVMREPLLHGLQLDAYRDTLWVAMILLIGMAITRYQRIALQSLMLQRELTIGLVVAMTTRLLVVLGVIWQFGRMSVTWGLGAMAIAEWLQSALQWTAYRRHVRELSAAQSAAAADWRPDYRELRRYALVNAYSSMLRQLSSKNALLLIGATYLPPPILAAFGFFQALGERVRPYLPVFLTRSLIEPVAMAHYLKERDFVSFTRVMSVAFKLNLLVLAPLLAWLTLSGTPALGAFTGGKFMNYTWVLVIIVFALVSTSHWALIELTANAIGRSMLLARASTLAAVLTLSFVALSQPRLGVLGLALTGVIGTLAGNFFVAWQLRRAGYRYRLDNAGVLRIALNAAGGGLAGLGVAHATGLQHSATGSLAALVLGAMVFAVMSLFNRPFTSAEWDILVRLLPRRLRRRQKEKR